MGNLFFDGHFTVRNVELIQDRLLVVKNLLMLDGSDGKIHIPRALVNCMKARPNLMLDFILAF